MYCTGELPFENLGQSWIHKITGFQLCKIHCMSKSSSASNYAEFLAEHSFPQSQFSAVFINRTFQ